jgi:hypothetical protein
MIYRLLLILLIGSAPLVEAATTETSEGAVLNNSIAQLLVKFESQQDGLYLALASNRCSALLAIVQGVLKRDANKDVYVGVPDRLSNLAWSLTRDKLEDRGVRLDDARLKVIDEELNDDFTSFVKAYSQRMEANRKTNGDMWGSDPMISKDLEACKEIAAAVAD